MRWRDEDGGFVGAQEVLFNIILPVSINKLILSLTFLKIN